MTNFSDESRSYGVIRKKAPDSDPVLDLVVFREGCVML